MREAIAVWLTRVSFYDKYGRVIQTQSDNHLGGTDVSNTAYDFAGKVLGSKSVHQSEYDTVTIRSRFVYDHRGEVLEVYQQNNDDPEVLVL